MKNLVLAATLAVSPLVIAAPANATVYTVGLGSITVPPSYFPSFGTPVSSGAVEIDYTFTLASALTMNSSTFTSSAGNPFTFTSVALYNSSNVVLSSSTNVDPVGTSGGFSMGLAPYNLAAGSYTVKLFGNATGSAGVGSSFSFVAVPEPATWGMMIVGFGMLGATMRYRRRSTTTAFA